MDVVLKGWRYSTDCRHTFCANCLFEWWARSRGTTCPSCRTVCENVPARDRSNGLISLLSGGSNESVPQFDTTRFAELMQEIQVDAQAKLDEAEAAVMVVDYRQAGTAENPLDLTNAWR